MGMLSRLRSAWNAFRDRDPTDQVNWTQGMSSSYRLDRYPYYFNGKSTIINPILNRIAVDCATIKISHVSIDESNRFKERLSSDLNERLEIEANKDQTSRAFLEDIYYSLFSEGQIAVVPVDTDRSLIEVDNARRSSDKKNPERDFNIFSLRVARITNWFTDYVEVELYDDRTGQRNQISFPKSVVAIIENPFYETMNEPNSTLQRLISKLNLLDSLDNRSYSDKLNILIKLPYAIKNDLRLKQAEMRRKALEDQLYGDNRYGVGYIDATENVIQLNRAIDNNLLTQIESLQNQLFSQLGLSASILDGSASEEVMNNYYSRTVEPIVSAVCDEFNRKFLSEDQRSSGQRIMYFNDPFRLVPTSKLAEIADKFTRNEILSSNELRIAIGYVPSKDPAANELRNANLNRSDNENVASV